jgi:hypothetical protein
MGITELLVGDIVNFTSKRFNHKEKDKVWMVIEKNVDYLILQADDSHLIKLSPPRGKHTVMVPYKYIDDFTIIKQTTDEFF